MRIFRSDMSIKLQWSDYQKAVFEDVANGIGNTIIEAKAGSSKCLGKGTEVLMFDGSIKKVEDVVIGELLMGPDSKPRTVLNIGSGGGNLVRIDPVKGDSWICNDDHVLTLIGTNKQKGQI